MKKTIAIASACMLTFALSACSGNNYVMHTNDGRSSCRKVSHKPIMIPA